MGRAGVKCILAILLKGRVFEEFFLNGLMRKRKSIFGGDFKGFLDIASFPSKLLFDVLFTSRLKDVALLVFHFFSLFRLIKSFVSSFYFY